LLCNGIIFCILDWYIPVLIGKSIAKLLFFYILFGSVTNFYVTEKIIYMVTKQDDNKVFKWWELQSGGFLSGLWFAQQVEADKKADEEEKETSVASPEDLSPFSTPSKITIKPKIEWWTGRNARVIRRASPTPSRNRSTDRNRSQHSSRRSTWTPTPVVPVVKREKKAKTSATLVKKEAISMGESISVKEFAEKMWVPHMEVMKQLLANKIMVTINSSIDFETASLIASEFNVEVTQETQALNVESFMLGDLQALLDSDKEAETKKLRWPIVTVMGHVDHGKTSLLDYLRKTNIAWGEAGWITQSIWASVITHDDKPITFIDTPGHELFTTLRARWAKMTNVAIIVVAADDGIMPQTKESIDHAKAAWVPIIIAVTKIDKPQNNFEKIKNDLGSHWIVSENRGWDVPVIWVSSVTWQGIDDLLEAILLQSEMLELYYNPNRSAVGVVLDAHKDAKQWVVSSIIVLTGTLRVWDVIVAYNTYGKVKRMQNWKWEQVKAVTGWEPVQILGLSELPEAGRMVEIVTKEKDAQEKISQIQEQADLEKAAWSTVEQFLANLETSEATELRLILKADWASSLEALEQAVDWIELPASVTIKVISTDVWHFSDSDISLAQASKALLLGFNVSISTTLKKKSQALQVEVKSYSIIYELTEYLTQLTQGMIEIEYEDVSIGKLEILWVFFRKGKEMVIGWKVWEWTIKNKCKFIVWREEGDDFVEVGKWTIMSLQKEQQTVKEVATGHECGMKVKVSPKVIEGDVLEFFEKQEKVPS